MKQNEYLEKAKKFRADMRDEFGKSEAQRNIPDDWLTVTAESVCKNPKCPVYEVAFRVNMSENLDGVYRAVCGRCSTWVQNLTPIFDDGPGEKLPVSKDDPRAEPVDLDRRPDHAGSNNGNGRR